MSIKVMTKIWSDGPLCSPERFVLLSLADFANDKGECWPSIAGVAAKCAMSERGVQKIIRRLEAGGWLETVTGNGRRGANQYKINPEPCSPPNDVHPEHECKNPEPCSENPEPGSPEPSITIKEPSSLRAREAPPQKAPSPESDRFEEFWQAYPHRGGAKKGKAPSKKKYLSAVKSGVSESEIIEAATRYHRDRKAVEGFSPDPATWLNQRGWEDEIEPPRPKQPVNQHGHRPPTPAEYF